MLHLNPAETETGCFTYRGQTALQTGAPELLQASAVDGKHPQHGRVAPNVYKSETGKLTAPAQSQEASTEEGETPITAELSSTETPVAEPPYTVITVSTVWFSKHVLKRHLVNERIKLFHRLIETCIDTYQI